MEFYTKWPMTVIDAVFGESVFELFGIGSTVELTTNKSGNSNIRGENKICDKSIKINYIIYIVTESEIIEIRNGETK